MMLYLIVSGVIKPQEIEMLSAIIKLISFFGFHASKKLPHDFYLQCQDRYAKFIIIASIASLVGFIALCFLINTQVSLSNYLAWFIFMAVGVLLYSIAPVLYLRARKKGHTPRNYITLLNFSAFLHGVSWGSPLFFLSNPEHLDFVLHLITLFSVAAICLAVLFAAHSRSAFYAYEIPACTLLSAFFITSPTMNSLSVCGPLLFVICAFLHQHFYHLITQEIITQHELEKAKKTIITAHEELIFSSSHDTLTGLLTRSAFTNKLDEYLLNSKVGALFFIDLDDFKPVNDQFGHDVGDKYLTKVGEYLGYFLTQHYECARFGGDEFILLNKAITNASDAMLFGNTIRHHISQKIVIDNKIFIPQASIGGAIITPQDTTTQLLKRADIALYQSKRNNKNTVTVI